MRDGVSAAIGAGGFVAPVWLVWVDPVVQVVVSMLGLAVLVLTVWGKLIENRIKRLELESKRGQACRSHR